MTTRWGDEASDHNETSSGREQAVGSSGGAPMQRKKLSLKPRGSSTQATATASSSSRSSTSSIFGAAKPREEVLASKGIDAKLVDERIQKKATTVHYTREQNENITAIQDELTRAEANLRDANERELPEESYRVIVETKRKELHDLMEQYAKENAEAAAAAAAASSTNPKDQRRHYERPSERRKRLEEQRHDHQYGGGGSGGGGGGSSSNRYDHHHHDASNDDVYQHFGGRNKQHRGSHGGSRSSGHY